MTREQDRFKAEHEEFVQRIDKLDTDDVRGLYTKERLILHMLLLCEVFYVWDNRTLSHFWRRIHEYYTDILSNEVLNVYLKYRDFISSIYG